jgi:outer membrane protein assembly factor BamB
MLNLARRATSPPMSLGFSCAGARHPCEDLKKWCEVPIASRVQPVVASGRPFIGSMDGVMYARDASTGAPLWSFSSQGPIRNSAGVLNLVGYIPRGLPREIFLCGSWIPRGLPRG